jgi:hypothetical protein
MFLGHFAVGFASKRLAPKASLGPLLAAPQLLDLLWPIFLLLGVERVDIHASTNPFATLTFTSYPWSHSLVMSIAWGAVFGALYYAITRYRRGAWVTGAAVISHWALDAASHFPDIPLSPWGTRVVGLGLWRSVPATLVVELGMFAVGAWLYASGTSPRDRVGRYAWWGLVVLLLAAYLGSLIGPPPPSTRAIAWAGISGAVLILGLAVWADRHRTGGAAS